MSKHEASQKTAREIFQAINKDNAYLEQRAKLGQKAGAAALRGAALDIADNLKTANRGYETNESRQLRLVAAIPRWIRAQKRLDRGREAMTRSEKDGALTVVTEFNHILREMIDAEQYDRVSGFQRFVQEALLSMCATPEVMQYAANALEAVLNGMRHEIAAESVLSALPGVEEVRGATTEEERTGKDIVVIYRGCEVSLDIKASQKSADAANLRAAEYAGRHNLPNRGGYTAVWSGFSRRDFGDRIVPTKEQLANEWRQGMFTAILDEAAQQRAAGKEAIAISA